MELTNQFTVDVPVERAWAVLTDLERIAPCMPGAQLEEVDGDDYRGVVRVKVGPITAEYRGNVQFLERDMGAHKAVLRAVGRETRGQGNASATITALLEPSGSATTVSVVTDLSISGRVAQFGRGVLADVSNRLLGEFVEHLEATVLSESGSTGAQDEPASSPDGAPPATAATGEPHEDGLAAGGDAGGQRSADTGEPVAPVHDGAPVQDGAPVNLLRVVGPGILKRLLPPAVLGFLFVVWRRRRRRRG